MIHQRLDGGNHCHRLPVTQRFQRLNALTLNQIGMNIRLIKNKIFGRKKGRFPIKESIILLYFTCALLTVGDDQLCVYIFRQSTHEMSLLSINAAGHLQDARVCF